MKSPRSRPSRRGLEESNAIRTPDPARAPSEPPRARAGAPFPLGAHADGDGTSFAVFSRVAERVELCLFDETGRETRVDLPERTGYTWHGYLPGIGAGQRYGYRVHGPWDPARGMRCNPHKLLLDPYARAIEGEVRWSERIHAHVPGHPFIRQESDSAPDVPRSIVVAGAFDWEGDEHPRVPDEDTVIYETHVKGFSQRHPGVPPELRGTYAGMAHPAALEHLQHAGRDVGRAAAGPPLRPRRLPAGARAAQLLGLQHHRLLRPSCRVRCRRQRRPAGRRVQGHGQGLPRVPASR